MTDEAVLRLAYSCLGLVLAWFCIVAAVRMSRNRSTRTSGRYRMRVGGFEIDAAAPWLAFAFLALLIIWLTRL